MRAADGPQRFQTVEVRHRDIEQDHVGREARAQGLEEFASAVKDVHGVPARLQQRLQEVGECAIIVDDSETCRHGTEASSGNATPTAPRALAYVQIRPPAVRHDTAGQRKSDTVSAAPRIERLRGLRHESGAVVLAAQQEPCLLSVLLH